MLWRGVVWGPAVAWGRGGLGKGVRAGCYPVHLTCLAEEVGDVPWSQREDYRDHCMVLAPRV